MEYCENCGCKVYSGCCVNCDEELFIIDQYKELKMSLPEYGSEFMQKARESEARINVNKIKNDLH